MKPQSIAILPLTLVVLLSFFLGIALADSKEKFLQCLYLNSENTSSISKIIYTQNNPSYSSVYDFLKQNLLLSSPTLLKPQVIVMPFQVSQIQTVLKCSKKHDLQIRVRSGGHDVEGLSYHSDVPFVMIDMIKFSSIDVNVNEKNVWVGAGVTIGELYYKIGEKSKNLAFPAGVCPTVGVGGHLSGGGYGYILRKFGLGIDQVIDAHLIDINGRILDRKSMGEDLFWAIRGGGVASFGILVAWKINLVDVPSTVTVFRVQKTLEQNATKLFQKWQHIAHKLPEEIVLTAALFNSLGRNRRSIFTLFQSLFLGGIDKLLPLMQERFPELGLKKDDCNEMSWVESTVFFTSFKEKGSTNLEVLVDRNFPKTYQKMKSDYLRKPIPVKVLEGMYKILNEEGGQNIGVISFPYGGKMSEISEITTPFPHRAGNKFHIMYFAEWDKDEESQRIIDLNRKLYNYMTPYVSKNPRATYFNTKDLDIGRNNKGDADTSVKEASIWGKKYFKNNFHRLVDVKTMVDPGNFFRNEQSIPPRSP